jgi:anaerobic magnesium-protoporphyrin IX monomethyl ester cyclase
LWYIIVIMHKIKRVALIYPALKESASKFQLVTQRLMPRPKLGLDYICAALARQEIKCQVFDQTLVDFNRNRLISLLKKGQFDLIGFYTGSYTLKQTVLFTQEIKKNLSIPVIAGGPGCIHYNELIEAGCEIVCHGEGDQTIIEIIDCYQGNRELSQIKGISYYDTKRKQILSTPRRPLIENLDNLAFPLRDPKTIGRYCDYLSYPLKKPYITILASRGCPYRCAFCTSYSFWGMKYRQRSVENVIEEIEQAASRFSIKYIYFLDDVFALDFNWLEKFCLSLSRKKHNLKWMCMLHPMSFQGKKDKIFSMMAESGCTMVSFGAQSANAAVLQNVNRSPSEPEELSKSIDLSKKAGITVVVTYIFGLPGDTAATLRQNLDFCLKTKPHMVDFHSLGILPGSDIATTYQGRAFTELQERELIELCARYTREYYANPEVISQLLKDILQKNPAWFFTFVRFAPYLLRLFT